jgi:hypothetical protein
MLRSPERLLAAALAAAALGPAAEAAAPPAAPSAAPSLARLSLAEQRVELSSGRAWTSAREGAALRVGGQVRTGPDSLARLELPWMAITLGPGSILGFPEGRLLAAVLRNGRLLIQSGEREILKVVAGDAEVRGQGRAVVRRQDGRTLVSALAGRFAVVAAGHTVTLRPGTGTVVDAGRPPREAMALPDAPDDLSPGADPRFVAPGEPVALSWTTRATAHQIEVLPVGSDEVLIQRDVGAPPWRLVIPWPGAFRWRVAARDQNGLEGRPSTDGLICTDP